MTDTDESIGTRDIGILAHCYGAVGFTAWKVRFLKRCKRSAHIGTGDLVASDGHLHTSTEIEFEADPAELAALREWLRPQPDQPRAGMDVRLAARQPAPGELGAVDVLAVLASSSVLATAIRTLPDFLRSRRSGVRIEATIREEKFVIDATNLEEVLPLLDRLLDD